MGISGKGKNVVTKHDAKINGIKNALKVMDTVMSQAVIISWMEIKDC